MSLDSKIKTIIIKLQKWLFNNSQKEINDFKNDGTILDKNKWSNILNYPYNFKKLLGRKCSIEHITELVREYFINKGFFEKQYLRVIHPVLIIISYEHIKDLVEIRQNKTNNIIYIHPIGVDKIQIQTNLTFQLYWKLITDKNIESIYNFYFEKKNKMIMEAINSLLYNSTVEEEVIMDGSLYDTCNRRYIDYSLSLDISEQSRKEHQNTELFVELYKNKDLDKKKFLNKILIEFNEDHHQVNIDELRKINVFNKTNLILNQFVNIQKKFNKENDENSNMNLFYEKILKLISKIIYKNIDNMAGFLFYLVCFEKFECNTVEFFLDLYEKGDCFPITNIIQYFETEGFTNANKFFSKNKKSYMNETYISKIEDNEIYLNSIGVDRAMGLPRNDDWEDISIIISLYTKFRTGYFKSIQTFLSTNGEETIIQEIALRCDHIFDSIRLLQPLYEIIIKKFQDELYREQFEKHFKVKLDEGVPLFYESSNSDDILECRLLYELFGTNLADRIIKQLPKDSKYIMNRRIINNDMIEYLLLM